MASEAKSYEIKLFVKLVVADPLARWANPNGAISDVEATNMVESVIWRTGDGEPYYSYKASRILVQPHN